MNEIIKIIFRTREREIEKIFIIYNSWKEEIRISWKLEKQNQQKKTKKVDAVFVCDHELNAWK